ncbi:hypothetical protein [Geofilum rhodophaeum]|uniref:hypothetical protein n=1 Tax=Geofilum rhodophaeum TaxID=1965019 RepID=UPI000B5204C6|nr:hypothetical protein [Geofilum rhodophaeum]
MKKSFLFLLILTLSYSSCRKSDYELSDQYSLITDNGNGIGTTTWTADKNYLISGQVYVNDGQTLTIEPGTIIRAKTGQGEKASALIVARGGKIIANGTAQNPIIFTVEGDDLQGSVPIESNGLWGGVIILGHAPVNATDNENYIEGIPFGELRATYGGNQPEDNSGSLRYVSIRHGGTHLSAGNEINGLTLGGVGNGTTLEYIEVISNRDDGFEFFGGNVNARYLVSAYNGDDAFDFDLGYKGHLQHLVGIQGLKVEEDINDPALLIELSDREGYPQTRPILVNGTFIGKGPSANNAMLRFDKSASGHILNSIFIGSSYGLQIEYKGQASDSYQLFVNKNLQINNNLFHHVANNSSLQIFSVYTTTGQDISDEDALFKAHFSEGQNTILDPGLNTQLPYQLQPTISDLGPLAPLPDSPHFQNVPYKGALAPDHNWLQGWTLLSTHLP